MPYAVCGIVPTIVCPGAPPTLCCPRVREAKRSAPSLSLCLSVALSRARLVSAALPVARLSLCHALELCALYASSSALSATALYVLRAAVAVMVTLLTFHSGSPNG